MTSKEPTTKLADQAGELVENNPMLAVAGAFVAGVVAGSVIPKIETESETYHRLANRMKAGVSDVVGSARAVGNEELERLGLTGPAMKSALNGLVGGIIKAAMSSGAAAAAARQAVKSEQDKTDQQNTETPSKVAVVDELKAEAPTVQA